MKNSWQPKIFTAKPAVLTFISMCSPFCRVKFSLTKKPTALVWNLPGSLFRDMRSWSPRIWMHMTTAAFREYHMAQYRLGKMIYMGDYYRRIPENAEYWLLLSAKQNNPYAEALLGRLYLTGDFLRLDRKAGVDLLYDAIRHGNAHAAYTLGKYYADGKCLKKDIPKAIALLEQAAQMGDIHAEYRLAKIYLFESDCFDWQKAVEYLNTAAHKGNENAYRALQNMSRNTVISITTGIADLIGDLSAMFDERPAVEDCTTMTEHRERKKYEYEQSL